MITQEKDGENMRVMINHLYHYTNLHLYNQNWMICVGAVGTDGMRYAVCDGDYKYKPTKMVAGLRDIMYTRINVLYHQDRQHTDRSMV